MKYVLGIDFGGGSSKATLLSEEGKVIKTASSEYATIYPKNGYVEQNPMDWYEAAKTNIKSILQNSGVKSEDIVCISLDAATHTAVLCDEDFNVVCPSIYWTDTRSVKQVGFLKENYGDLIWKKSYHNVGTIWTIAQLLWIKENEPQILEKTKHIFFAKDFVRHMLTDDFCTDYIEAQGSMFYDMEKKEWSKELCDLCGVDISTLPELKNPKDIVGSITKKAAADTGLCEGTRVICGSTDTVMEVFAAGAVKEGNMTIKLATAGRICAITPKAHPDANLVNYSHIVDGMWYPGTATKACASSYRWYRDTFGGDYKDLDDGAEQIEVGCDGLMYHPYLNGELTPYNDPDLCASFIGIRGGHTKAHFTRAVLEGVALSMLDCMKTLDSMNIKHDIKATAIGGGSKSPLWRQILSDCLGIELVVKETSDSSFGSAMLAGVAAGFWKDEAAALDACSKIESITKPDLAKKAQYEKLYTKYKAVHDALEGIYK